MIHNCYVSGIHTLYILIKGISTFYISPFYYVTQHKCTYTAYTIIIFYYREITKDSLFDLKFDCLIQIIVADKMLLTGPLIPLLLPCGHSICSGCVKRKAISCSSCKISTENYDIEKLPLNLYVLGLLVSSCQRPLENDDHDFAFHAASRMRPLQIKNQGWSLLTDQIYLSK